MKFQLGWLREHLELTETADEVADRLTAVGLTVDDASGEGDGTVFDLDIGANRCDAMSHVGVARELAVALQRRLQLPEPSLDEDIEPVESAASLVVEDADLCPHYLARVVRDVQLGPSPPWMAARLDACGIRPINVIVDVTNYVLLELGHPLHAFDLDLLAGERVVVRRARSGETLQTLDGEERQLWPDALLIADAEQGIALAGVMGGANSEIRDSTRDVLLESAWFDPISIRRTARRVGLRTEASHRFERGADADVLGLALDRAAELLADLAGGRVLAGRLAAGDEAPPLREIRLRKARLARVTGARIPDSFVDGTLPALGFELIRQDHEGWSFWTPRRRHDVRREEDLIEEVLRHWGYDRVEATLPAFREGARPRLPWEDALHRVRTSLVGSGYHQVVNFTFGERDDVAAWGGSLGTDHASRAIPLDNPIADNLAVMRTSLVPGLLRAASRAVRREETDLLLFEEGCIYLRRESDGETPAEERRTLALVASGLASPRHFTQEPTEVDLLAVKGALLAALRSTRTPGMAALEVRAGQAPHCAPGAAEIVLAGRRIGWLGRLHPDALRELEIEQPLFAAEVDLEPCLPTTGVHPVHEAVSRFPKAVRDLSVLVDRNRSYGDIIGAAEELRTGEGGLAVESVALVDRYLGRGVPDGQVSLTFSVTYRRADRTLTQDEVDALHGRLLHLLEERVGARLRG